MPEIKVGEYYVIKAVNRDPIYLAKILYISPENKCCYIERDGENVWSRKIFENAKNLREGTFYAIEHIPKEHVRILSRECKLKRISHEQDN